MQDSVKYVPGKGNKKPKIVFVGEAPGAEEAEQGQPFVGASGRLLDEALVEMGWKREDVYITNVVKVRPLNNRPPSLEEVQSWVPHLLDELESMDPYVIITLGATAARAFDSTVRVTRDRGHVERVQVNGLNYWVAPVFHPSYVLRGYCDKKSWFMDFGQIKYESGLA